MKTTRKLASILLLGLVAMTGGCCFHGWGHGWGYGYGGYGGGGYGHHGGGHHGGHCR